MRHLIFALIPFLAAVQTAGAEPPNIVTDIAPVHSLVTLVTGDLADPALLLSGNDDPHHVQLRPSQARAISGAEVIFWIGPGLTPWLENTIKTIGPDATVITLLDLEGTNVRHSGDGGYTDPHAWLDPENAIFWIDKIAETLTWADPDNDATYRRNSTAAIRDLKILSAEIADTLAPVAAENFMTSHDAFGYFADRFDLNIVASISDGEATNPGAARLAELRNIVQSGAVTCVFNEIGESPKLIEMVTEGTDTRTATLDPVGNSLTKGAALYGELIHQVANGIRGCAE